MLMVAALLFVGALFAYPGQSHAAELSTTAKTCAPAYFIGARGSGEKKTDGHGLGTLLDAQYQQLLASLHVDGKVLEERAVKYPAVSVFNLNLINGSFQNSVEDGVADLLHQIDDLAGCKKKPKIIVAGYSQGAVVVRWALQDLPSSQRSMIVGAIVYGDPGFDPNDDGNLGTYDGGHYGALVGQPGSWPSFIKKKLISACTYGDNVCNLTVKLFGRVNARDILQFNTFHFSQHSAYIGLGYPAVVAAVAISRFGLRAIVPTAAPKPTTTALPADVVFVIDTTGSMSSIIDNVKASVASMATNLAAASSSFRVGLVEYKDDQDSPFQSHKVLDFTTDLNAFTAALGTLDADGGGDWPESVYSGLMTAFEMPFRPGVKKSVIAIGDAPPKEPEPITGFTANQVIAKALSIDPAQVFVSFDGSDLEPEDKTQLDKITSGTGGASFYDSTGGAQIANNVKAAIDKTGATPLISFSVPAKAIPGKSYKFGAVALSEDIATKYEWDFNGDGVYDSTTTVGKAKFKYPAAGTFTAAVRVSFADGRVALGSGRVVAGPPVNVKAPGKLKKVKSKLKGSTLTLTITLAKKGAPADQILIVDKRGHTVGNVATTPKKSKYKVKVKNLKKGKFSWVVHAANDFGTSKATSVKFRVKR
jgi:pimeloyl-ACP methyl ester carboxylesterase